jgi:hypothetical protein
MKKIRLIVLLIVLSVVFSSCSVLPSMRENREETTKINPLPEAANKIGKEVTLYFRYIDENMLAGETRNIDVPVNERIEMTVLNEIFNGPSQDSQELFAVIPENASIVSVSDSGDYLFVTLSAEFISESKLAAVQIEDEEAYTKAKEEMNLCIYSVVNTLIELGGFSRIQILIDTNDSGRGERIKLIDIGVESLEGASLEPLGWDGSLILNPENTVGLLLEVFGKRDFEKLYSLIAYNDSENINSPSKDEFIGNLSSLETSIEEHSVLDSKVSADGQSVIVPVSFTQKNKNGDTITKDNIILKLRRERNLWKVEYSSFKNVFLQE